MCWMQAFIGLVKFHVFHLKYLYILKKKLILSYQICKISSNVFSNIEDTVQKKMKGLILTVV